MNDDSYNSIHVLLFAGLSNLQITLLSNPEVEDYVRKDLKNKKLNVRWQKVGDLNLVLSGTSLTDTENGFNHINMKLVTLTREHLPVEGDSQKTGIKDYLKGKNRGLVEVMIDYRCIYVVAVDYLKLDIMMELDDCIDKRSTISTFMDVSAGRLAYALVFKTNEYMETEQASSVDISIVHEQSIKGFRLTGPKGKCKDTIEKLRNNIDCISERTFKLQWPGFERFAFNQRIKNRLTQIQLQNKCLLKIHSHECQGHDYSDPDRETLTCISKCKIGGSSISYALGKISEIGDKDVLVAPVPKELEYTLGFGKEIALEGK